MPQILVLSPVNTSGRLQVQEVLPTSTSSKPIKTSIQLLIIMLSSKLQVLQTRLSTLIWSSRKLLNTCQTIMITLSITTLLHMIRTSFSKSTNFWQSKNTWSFMFSKCPIPTLRPQEMMFTSAWKYISNLWQTTSSLSYSWKRLSKIQFHRLSIIWVSQVLLIMKKSLEITFMLNLVRISMSTPSQMCQPRLGQHTPLLFTVTHGDSLTKESQSTK